MRTSRSQSLTVRPCLEQLETREMPSTLGSLMPFITDRLIVQKGLKNSDYWTTNLENDWNALQTDLGRVGPNNPTTIADLSKTMADYGFAEQTYNLSGNTAELFRAGIAFGISNGFFDQSDLGPILVSLRDIQNLENISNSQASTAHRIANTPFPDGAVLGGQQTLAQLSHPPYIYVL